MKTQKDNTSTQDAKSTRELAMEYWGKLGVIRANELRSKYFPDYMLIDNEQIETIYLSEHPSTPPMEEEGIGFMSGQDLMYKKALDKLADVAKENEELKEENKALKSDILGGLKIEGEIMKENKELKNQVKVLREALRTLVDRLNTNWDAITSGGQNGILTALTKEAKQALNL